MPVIDKKFNFIHISQSLSLENSNENSKKMINKISMIDRIQLTQTRIQRQTTECPN